MTKSFTASDFWDERYQDADYIYGLHPNDFLREHAGIFKPGDRILTLAEGEGRNAVFLAQQGCAVRGVDFSAQGREKALKLAADQDVHIDYDIADLTTYDMGAAQWDGIVSIFCHLADTQRPALFEATRKALKPGGMFILESYNKKQLAYGTGGPGKETHLVSLDELKNVFHDFEITLAQDIERDVREGQGHTGKASVTQLIVRKPA